MSSEKSQLEKFQDAMREYGMEANDPLYAAMVERVATSPKLSDNQIKTLAEKLRKEKRRK